VSRSIAYSSSPLLTSKTPVWRSKLIVAGLALAFLGLAGRAAYVQVIGNDFFLHQGEVRYGRTLVLPANRGRILDRNGLILASSVPAPSLWAIPEDVDRDPVKLRELAAQKLGLDPVQAEFANNAVRADGRSFPLTQAAANGELVGEDTMEYGDLDKKYQQSTFGAHFVEVGVDAATGEIRVRRMLAVCAAGRILNPKAARSQVIGAMTMGVGAALMEDLVVDHRAGFFVNHDLAGYEVPVHADIPHQEVVFLDETDPISSPMKAKGVGELGICGVGAAVANAVYNATGVRVRDYPITLDKLIAKMPEV